MSDIKSPVYTPPTHGEPRNWYVHDRLAEIRTSLSQLEYEMTRGYFVGDRAEEAKALGERLVNLAKADKGHLTGGAVAVETVDEYVERRVRANEGG